MRYVQRTSASEPVIRGPVGPSRLHNRPLRVQREGATDLKLPRSCLQERVGTYRLVYHSVLSPKHYIARKKIKGRGREVIYTPCVHCKGNAFFNFKHINHKKIAIITLFTFYYHYYYYYYTIYVYRLYLKNANFILHIYFIIRYNLKYLLQLYFY